MAIIIGINHRFDGVDICCVEVSFVSKLISLVATTLYEYKSADISTNTTEIVHLFQRHSNHGYAFSVQRRRIHDSRASHKVASNLTGNNDDI